MRGRPFPGRREIYHPAGPPGRPLAGPMASSSRPCWLHPDYTATIVPRSLSFPGLAGLKGTVENNRFKMSGIARLDRAM